MTTRRERQHGASRAARTAPGSSGVAPSDRWNASMSTMPSQKASTTSRVAGESVRGKTSPIPEGQRVRMQRSRAGPRSRRSNASVMCQLRTSCNANTQSGLARAATASKSRTSCSFVWSPSMRAKSTPEPPNSVSTTSATSPGDSPCTTRTSSRSAVATRRVSAAPTRAASPSTPASSATTVASGDRSARAVALHPNALPMIKMRRGWRPLVKSACRKWISCGAIPPPTVTGAPSSSNSRVNGASGSPKYNGFNPVRIRYPCWR